MSVVTSPFILRSFGWGILPPILFCFSWKTFGKQGPPSQPLQTVGWKINWWRTFEAMTGGSWLQRLATNLSPQTLFHTKTQPPHVKTQHHPTQSHAAHEILRDLRGLQRGRGGHRGGPLYRKRRVERATPRIYYAIRSFYFL